MQPPDIQINFNIDIQDNLLEKSKRLGIYKNLIQHNADNALPFLSDEIDSIYSNTMHWFKNPLNILRECHKIAKKGARIAFSVPNETQHLLSNLNKFKSYNFDKSFLHLLDRGRHSSERVRLNQDQWIEFATDAQWKFIHVENYIPDELIALDDIGMRPLSPLLIPLVNGLSEDQRVDYKRQFTKDIYPYIEGCAAATPELEQHSGTNAYFFVFEK